MRNSLRGTVNLNYLKLFLGDEGQDIIDGFNLSAEEMKKLDSYWTKLQQHALPKSNFHVARAQLRELKQKLDETVDSFMTRARVLAEDCEYKDKEEKLIDTLILGVLSIDVRSKLLTKDSALKLNDAMKMARAEEATQKHMSALQETKTIGAMKSTPRTQSCQQNKPNYSTQPKRPPFMRQNVKQQQGCLNCRPYQQRDITCPAHKATCNFCGKKGHWEKVCITKQNHQKGKGQQTARCQPAARNKFNALEHAGTSDSQNSDETTNITFDSSEYSSLTGEELFATVRMQGEREDHIIIAAKWTPEPLPV